MGSSLNWDDFVYLPNSLERNSYSIGGNVLRLVIK